ncbi:class I SAM-dependent RNA methyltransferase [Roseobacter ponti]|uniref:Class I SAM-dependent RNA methyltransferase n=1 Tax=Roseobacter ponti TaxID=1891787 RepID=A0A858SPY3_9RHOB|nr:class I SAM-dependent RNA methyltransferase [Roseobacter ponti]QJF49753.1 class I SAM-dependent RNA methyltransferase [Roseobacter ponti]
MTGYRISRLGLQGDGVAGGPVFIPLTLPGEEVEAEVIDGRARDVKIITPSDRRVAAPCAHFRSCGGCQLQHADDDFVASWKTDVVRNALKAHGTEAVLRPILTSPAGSRRRAGFAARRTKKGAMAGFHGRASDTIIEIPGCLLLAPDVLAGREVAEALALVGASRKTALSVMVTGAENGLDVAVSHGKPLDGPLRQQLAAICESKKLARLTWEDEVVAMREPPVHSIGAAQVSPPPGAFLQATLHGQQVLTDAVLEVTRGARRVIDLFAGCGTFSLPLAQHAEVHAVEGEAAMLASLDGGWRHAKGLKAITTETRDLFRRPLMPDELRRTGAVVLDPPRAGAEAQIAELIKSDVAKVAYVSCNPVTFARDAAVLVAAGWSADWVQVVDQFRWSSHVELAGSFTAPHMQG